MDDEKVYPLSPPPPVEDLVLLNLPGGRFLLTTRESAEMMEVLAAADRLAEAVDEYLDVVRTIDFPHEVDAALDEYRRLRGRP